MTFEVKLKNGSLIRAGDMVIIGVEIMVDNHILCGEDIQSINLSFPDEPDAEHISDNS